MKFVPKKLTRALAKKVLQTKHNSPHIFFAAGVAGVIGAAYLSSKATLKLNDTLEDIHAELDDKAELAKRAAVNNPDYTEMDYYRDLGYIYGKSGWTIVKLYGPAIVVGAASIAALTGSHIQLTRRNTALSVTLAGISKAFEEYRGRVRTEIGEPREKELYDNIEVYEVKGEQFVRKVNDTNDLSMHSRVFDSKSSEWYDDAERNRIFLQAQQSYFNNMLISKGYVFLNDVYLALGLPESSAGQIAGWIINGNGANHVDFGMFSGTERSAAFLNGETNSIILDFNVDGVIYDQIG